MGKRGMFTPEAAHGANTYVITLALPAMVFYLLARADLGHIEQQVLAVYLGSEIALYALTFAIMRYGFDRPVREAALIGQVSGFPNHVFLSLLIAETLYGPQGAAVSATMVAFDVVIIFGGTIVFLESRRGGTWPRAHPVRHRNQPPVARHWRRRNLEPQRVGIS